MIQNTLLKLFQLNLSWEGSITQVHSNACRPLFGLIKTFHMGGSTLQKLSHSHTTLQNCVCERVLRRHILLLDFVITTYKPTEICQVSCKNQLCISARVSDDTSNPARVSNDISEPIRLWHVSPIRLRHVSLTHPQTPINRSLPKAFQKIQKKGWKETKIEKSRSSVGTKLWSLQKLQELQPSNPKNIWSGIIQIIFLHLKVHWNQAQKPLETLTNHKSVKLYGFKPPKPQRTSTTNLQIWRTFEAESSKLPT